MVSSREAHYFSNKLLILPLRSLEPRTAVPGPSDTTARMLSLAVPGDSSGLVPGFHLWSLSRLICSLQTLSYGDACSPTHCMAVAQLHEYNKNQ